MTYETSVNFSGDPRRATQFAIDALAAANLRITSRTDSALEFRGPGMNSTNENPLVGVSQGRLTVTGHTASIHTELGGVRRMVVFLVALILVIELVGGLVAFLSLRGRVSTLFLCAVVLGPVAPWAVLIPLVASWMKRRTTAAIDTLMHNLSRGGEPG